MLARLMISFTAVCSFAGCTVADYKEPIGELHTVVAAAIDSVNAFDVKLTEARNECWRAEISRNDSDYFLSTPKGECGHEASACSQRVKRKDRPTLKDKKSSCGDEPHIFPVTTVMPKSKAGLQALRAYVGKLKQIAEADTAAEVTTATTAALANAQKLEGAIADARGAKSAGVVAAYTPPITAAIRWLVGQYVDHVRINALARATEEAHPVIAKRSARLFQGVAQSVTLHDRTQATKAFDEAREQFEEAENGGKLTAADIDAYVAAVRSYDTQLKVRHHSPVAAFQAAHDKLRKHLNRDDGVTLADAMSAITDLRDRVNEFKSILDGVTEAEKRREGGNANN